MVDLDADVGFEVHPVALPHHEALSAGVDDDTMTVTLEPAADDTAAARDVGGNQPDGVDNVLVTSGVGVPTGAMILGKA